MRAPNQTRKMTACCSKVGIKRGPWTPEEDEILANFVKKEGEGRWRTLPKRAGLQRCGKSCRLRWMNYLRPSVKRGHIAPDEEDLILRLHRLLGNRWSLIAGRIPGRTDNEIKNYWNTHLSKKLISQGIDPRTHKPLITYNIASDPNETDTTSNPDHSIPQITTACTPALGIGSCSLSHDQNQTEAIQFQNMEMERYSCSEVTGVEVGRQHEKTVGEEDYTLSSFLDSLLNDNCVVGSQQPLTSSLQSFDLAFWEAEFPSATGKDEINIK